MRRTILTAAQLRTMTARATKESAFRQQIRAVAMTCGWLHYHTWDSRRSEPGFPDDVLVHPESDVVYMVELKRVGGQPTPEQALWLERLDGKRIDCRLWTPADWDEIETILVRRFKCESDCD